MLNFDAKSIERLNNPKVKVEDKLYLISRFIEEKYQLKSGLNYWEDQFGALKKEERIFYKIWLWLCYAEWETLTSPISEFEDVYGLERKKQLEQYLNAADDTEDNTAEIYQLNGEAGKLLFEWACLQLW